MITLISVLLVGLISTLTSASAQQAPPPPPVAAPLHPPSGGQSESSSAKTTGARKTKPLPSFLIIGTVFDEKALSLPGVQLRIRRVGEKKFRWETYTNTRGEFAVRVPPGFEYEAVAHMKNYDDQTQGIDSRADVQQRLSIQLKLRRQSKTGAKP